MSKQTVLQQIQADIKEKTEKNSITPIILGEIMANAVSLINTEIVNNLYTEGNNVLGIVRELEVPEGFTSIADNAFENENFSEISLPDSLISIGNRAFYGNDTLNQLNIPPNLETIGERAFSSINTCGDVVIPNSVTTIEIQAFRNSRIKSLVLGTGITEIPTGCFQAIGFGDAITALTIPANVTAIREYAFTSHNIETLVIPNTVTTLEQNAFASNNISDLTLGTGITTIPDNCFSSNNLSGNLVIPNNITDIGYRAFQFNNLDSVDVPTGCNVDADAFDAGVTVNYV